MPKQQLTKDDGGVYSSFALANKGKDVFIVFNDHPSNLKGSSRMYTMKKAGSSKVTLVRIDEAGKQKRVPLYSKQSPDDILRPFMNLHGDEGQLFLCARYRTSYKILNLEF